LFQKRSNWLFYVTLYIGFAASLLLNCDVSRFELVENMIQTMHITLILMYKHR